MLKEADPQLLLALKILLLFEFKALHTASLLTDHLVFFSPKYRGKVLEGKVAEAAEEVVIDEEKEEALKTGYITLYTKFFRAHRLRA